MNDKTLVYLNKKAKELAETWINGNHSDVIVELDDECGARCAILTARLVALLPTGDIRTFIKMLENHV